MALYVDITKKLGHFTLNVSFNTENETLALLGASGSGKSMTLKCIAGIEKPDSGKIVLNGRTIFDSEQHINLPPQKRNIGYLFQQYALFPNMNVFDNIKAGIRSGTRKEKNQLVTQKLIDFKIEDLAHKKPAQLSGGQQQRVALARIFVNAPELLLLDEPFSALDSYLKWQLELALANTLSTFSGGILYVSHNRNEVYRLCDSVCVLNNGTSDPKISVQTLFKSPTSVGAAMISGCKNISPAKRDSENTIYCSDWGVTLSSTQLITDDMKYVGIRAHHLTFEPNKNMMLCTVESMIDNVFSMVVMLKTPGNALLRMEANKALFDSVEVLQEISVYVAPEYVMILK